MFIIFITGFLTWSEDPGIFYSIFFSEFGQKTYELARELLEFLLAEKTDSLRVSCLEQKASSLN